MEANLGDSEEARLVRVAGIAMEAELQRAGDDLEGRPPAEILAWAAARFAPRVVFTTAFGAEGCVLIDLVAHARLPIEIVTVDTGLLFAETYALKRRLEERYAITIHAVRPELSVEEQARRYGGRLWERDPDACCAIRKVMPLRAALAGKDAWITSIRRDQTPERRQARVLKVDARFGVVKVNPLAAWSAQDVWAHLREHRVPFNPLHERGYPSLGCVPCTSPVLAGEDARAGRWRGLAKTECGLHAPGRPEGPEAAPRTGAGVPDTSEPLVPLFLKLASRRVVIVGGGRLAATRLSQLLAAGALVTVVAPEVRREIVTSRAEVVWRTFEPSDLDGAWFAVAAATPEVNRQVAQAATERRIFANAVDDPASATAYTGGVLRKGGVTIAVSTDGQAPALAGLLREALEALIPDELERWVQEARSLRERQRAEAIPMARRRPLLLRALNRLYAADASDRAGVAP